MIPLLDGDRWIEQWKNQQRPDILLAFYDHSIGAICRDPKLMLIPVDDHLVHRSDGVFETLSYVNRRILSIDEHLARLMRSAKGIELAPACSLDSLREIVIEVAKASGQDSGSIRILMGRGPGGFSIDPAECRHSSLYVAAYHSPPTAQKNYEKGLTACKSKVPVKPPSLAKIKTTSYLHNVLMTMEAKKQGVDVVIGFDGDNYLAEAAIANIAMVDAKGTLVIPEFRNALAGTTILKLAELLKDTIAIETRPVYEDEMFTASELLLLGTGPGCIGIVEFEGKTIGTGTPGPVAAMLKKHIDEYHMSQGTPF